MQLGGSGTFKKNKGGWLQELFAGLSRSPLLSKPIENTQRPWRNDIVRFELRGQQRMMHPPEIAFRIDSKLILKLRERLDRIRRPLQGLLVADSLDAPVSSFVELRANEEDAGAMQEAQGTFCVGVVLSRGESEGEVQRRVKEELRRCSERSGAIYSQNSRDSALSELNRATIRQLRVFLFFDEGREGLNVGRLLYFPRVSIPIRKISITQPTALTGNDVLERIKRTLNFKTDVAFGYISLNAGMAGDKYKFILLDRNDPELLTASPPVLGVWAAGALGTGLQREGAIWTVIMQYLTDPHLTTRLSVSGERSGLFFALDNPAARDRLTAYVFQLPANARWSISSRLQISGKLPEEYAFSQQEVIMEEEKEESQVQSIASRQERNKNNFQQNMQTSSAMVRALQQKDAQIKRLKMELDFYKTHYEKTMSMMQMAQQTQGSHLSTPPSYPHYEDSSIEEPFFGRRNHDEEVKEFSVRDMKNISFAQEQSFQEEPPANSILERQLKFTTPEFKESKDVKVRPQDVKAFNAPKCAEEANKKERERQREKEKQRQRQEEKERERQQIQRQKEKEKERERQKRERQKEKAAAQQRSISPSLIRSLQQKYGNYKTLSRNITNSPRLKQSFQDSGRKQQSQKSAPKRQEPPTKRGVFEQEPRDRRIKNELHSQEKEPSKQERQRELRKENQPSTNIPKKQTTSDIKSPEKKNGRSKSPLPEPPQKAKLLASDDEDDLQLAEIMSKRKKK